MYSYSTPAVILKKRDFREADRLYTLLTPEFGKIMVIAQGSRKLQSKLAGHLEVGGLANVMCIPGKSLDRLAGAVAQYSALDNMSNFGARWFFLDLVDALLHEGEKDHPLFEVVEEYLTTQKQSSHPLHLPYFAFRVFTILGFSPRLDSCMVCRQPLQDEMKFSPRHNGIAHKLCVNDDVDAFAIDPDTLQFLGFLAGRTWSMVQDVLPNKTVQRDLDSLMITISRIHSRRKLSTTGFLGI